MSAASIGARPAAVKRTARRAATTAKNPTNVQAVPVALLPSSSVPEAEVAHAVANPNAALPMGTLDEIFADLGLNDANVEQVLTQLRLAMGGCQADGGASAAKAVIELAAGRPYFDLADYMGRTWLRDKREGIGYCARVHQVKRSDHDRALHDHPWHNASIVLMGGYWEVMPGLFQAFIELWHCGGAAAHTALPVDPEEKATLQREVLALNALIQACGADTMTPLQLQRLAELGVAWRAPMGFTPRLASSLHRLIVPAGTSAWSLFIMRPKFAEWGFLTVTGWEHNETYLHRLGREA